MDPMIPISLARLALAAAVAPSPAGAGVPPAACADSTAAYLRGYAGDWAVQVVFLHPDAPAETWPGEARIEPDLDGCVLVEHLRTRRDSLPFEVLAVWGSHGGTPPYQRMMSHSQHGILGLYVGRREGDDLYLAYDGPLPAGGGRARHVIRRESADRFVFESQRAPPADTAWSVTWRASYRRRGT